MIAFGCEDKNRSPIIEDRVCPKCGRGHRSIFAGRKNHGGCGL